MAAPLSIGDIKTLIDTAIDIHRKLNAPHELVDRMTDELKHVKPYLFQLENFLQKNSQIEREAPRETCELRRNLKEIESVSEDVVVLFKDWRANQSFFKKAGFAFSSKPKELRDNRERMESLRGFIQEWILLANTRMLGSLHAARKQPSAPKPKSKDVLFVDKYDTGRAIVAANYAQLVQQWTEGNGQPWPFRRLHSAGLWVEGKRQVGTAQKALELKTKTSGDVPVPTALESLFDNKLFSDTSKASIWSAAKVHAARSVPNDCSGYDFIVVFDNYTKRKLEAVTAHVMGSGGKPFTGRLIRLANYHPSDKVRRITAPKRGRDPGKRDAWNNTTAQIKLAFKEFLMQEVGWKRPLLSWRKPQECR